MGGYAWVTLATNDAYSLGALVLAHSLRRVGTKYELAVLITPGVTETMRNNLAAVFSVVQEVNVLDSKDQANLALLARPELGITFTKLHCWRLTQYDKCVFLDADTLVVRNCDELFEREELSAAPDVGWPDCFNSGVFVYAPSQQTFASITAFAAAKGSFDGGDQGLLNMYFSDWAHKDISKHLPFIYNMCATATYSYLPAFKQYGEDVRIIHFIGITKPWLQYFDTMSGIVQPPQNCIHLQPLLQLWWNIFCEKVHPQLSPVMATSTLAPLWHEYVPMHFQSSIPKAPVHTDLCNDICDDAYVQKSDFSEFKDPWEDYRIQNVPITHNDMQECAKDNYHGGTESRVCHSCCESLSESSSEHHNETQNFLNSERMNEFNRQHHAFTQTDVHLHESSFVENTETNQHDTRFRVDHAPPSNESQHFHHPQRDAWEEQCHPHQEVHAEHEHRSQYHNNSHSKGTSRNGEAEENHNQHHQYSFDRVHQDVSQAKPQYNHEPGGEPHHCHGHRSSSFDRLSDDQSNKESSTSDRESNSTPRSSTETHGEHVGSEQRNGQLSINHNAQRSDNIFVEDQTDTQNVTSPPHSNPCTESRTVATQSDVNVMEHLETDDAGLAGALAQMTLGERRSAEQIALEEHMRKQSWEHGQIDYMGRDSFDNIWKKICETLALASPRSSPPKDIPTAAEASADAEKKDKVEVDNPDEAAVHLTQPESVVGFRGEQILVQEYNTDVTTVRECNTQSFTDVPEECVTKPSGSINISDFPLEDNSHTSLSISESKADLSCEKAPVEVLSCSSKERASKNLLLKESDVQYENVVAGERNLQQIPCSTPKDVHRVTARCGIATTLSEPVSHIETNIMCPIVLDNLVESPIIEKVTDSIVLEKNECANVADKRETREAHMGDISASTYKASINSQHSQKCSNQKTVTSSECPGTSLRSCDSSDIEQIKSSVSEAESESVSSQCQEASLATIEDSDAENQTILSSADPSIGLTHSKAKTRPEDRVEFNESVCSRITAGTAILAEEKTFGTKEDKIVCLTEKLLGEDAREMLGGALQSEAAVESTTLSDTMHSEFDLVSIAESLSQSIEPEFTSGALLSQETVASECEATLIAISATHITSPIGVRSGTKNEEIVMEEVITDIIEEMGREREFIVPARRHDNNKTTEKK